MTQVWDETFKVVAEELRKEFHRQFPFKDEGEVSPDILALRDAFYAFPASTDVALLDIDIEQAEANASKVWTLAKHDMSSSQVTIAFQGAFGLTDIGTHKLLLSTKFAINEDLLESIKSLSFGAAWDSEGTVIVQLVRFDIRERPSDYAAELSRTLLMFVGDGLIRRFKRTIDFNALYGLTGDAVRSFDQITKMDETARMLVNLATGKPLSIEDYQREIADIQLIPQVPADIHTTFRRAKDAHVFGYFQYAFSTMSQHYAYLALEAAIAARWSANLPQKVTLAYGLEQEGMAFPSHSKILRFGKRKNWDVRKTVVDGVRFPIRRADFWSG